MEAWERTRRWSARSSCSCGQDEKVVVLIGCTQHGKSSVIRSILQYGGYPDHQDYIGVGSGNRSETKEPKAFSLVLDIGQHMLRDEAGQERGFELQEGEDEGDIFAMDVVTRATGKHIHLRIIDTPGLDDSDNDSTGDGSTTTVGGEARRVKEVDEQHKAAILKQIAVEGRVHAVCFVLKISSPLNQSTQDALREYMSIFQMSNLARSFHFLHSQIEIYQLFQRLPQERPAKVNAMFPFSAKVKHHLTNSEPLEEVDMSQAHSLWATSQLLKDLSTEEHQPVRALRYPKSDGHRMMDTALEGVIATLKEAKRLEIDGIKRQIVALQAQLPKWKRRAETETESWNELLSRVKEIDTNELVQMGDSHERSDKRYLFDRSWVVFDINTTVPIRHYERSSNFKSTWASMPRAPAGTTNFYCRLDGTEYFERIWGSVTLFGWKKEVQATELKRRQEECQSAWDDLKATEKKIDDTKESIERLEGSIVSIRASLDEYQPILDLLRLDYVGMEVIRARGEYLASSSIVAYCYALGLALPIDRDQLPQGEKFGYRSGLDIRYYEKGKSAELTLVVIAETLVRLQKDANRKREIITALKTRSIELGSYVKSKLHGYDAPALGMPDADVENLSVDDRDRAIAILTPFREQLITRGDNALNAMDEFIENANAAIAQRREILQKVITRVGSLVDDNVAEQEKWIALQRKFAAIQAAVPEMHICTGERTHPIGVFSALKDSISRADATVDEAWDSLFDELAATFRCNPKGWDHFVEDLKRKYR